VTQLFANLSKQLQLFLFSLFFGLLIVGNSYATSCTANATTISADCDTLTLSNSNLTVTINSGVTVWDTGVGMALWNQGSANNTTIINNGAINFHGYNSDASVYNAGIITSFLNIGTIAGGQFVNVGTIGTLTNTGSIIGYVGRDIYNLGAIGVFNNLQGASSSALAYTGALPTNYNIIINSPTSFGRLAVTSGTGSTTFGIYTGSTVRNGSYASVLSGITSGNLTNTTGTFGSATWLLSNSSGSIWDLIISGIYTGPSVANTNQSLVNTASALQGTYTLQNSVMVNGFSYDCPVFDKYGVCVSVGGRNTTVQAQGINNSSGLLIASYRLDKNNSRMGAWVDQNLSVSSPGGTVNLGNSTPMIGLFGVWSQRPDGIGAEAKVSAAYGQKNTTMNRSVVGSGDGASEAGSGSSTLNSQGVQATAKYGFGIVDNLIVSPYVGVRYTQNNMGGYTEGTSISVTAPLTYSALNTNATTALAGVGASYKVIPTVTTFASAGVETDTNTANGTYSAANTSIGTLTPVNFNANPVKTRPTATLGAYYDIVKNQRLGLTGIYRQEAYQAVSTTTVMATYTIGL
jgi:Autotransporter beta-domain